MFLNHPRPAAGRRSSPPEWLSLATTVVAGVCLLVLVPSNREALTDLISRRLSAAAGKLAS